MVCGTCGRNILGDVPRCVYCGWTPDEKLKKIAEAGKVPRERFRSGATLWPFVGSAVILGSLAAGMSASWMARGAQGRDDPIVLLAVIGALVFMGPVLCAVQLLRRKLLWVLIDPEKGIETPQKGLIAWSRITSIVRYPGAFAYKNSLEQLSGSMPKGVGAYKYGCAILLVMIVTLIFLPVIVVLSPWHDRVTIVLQGGERIVLRDLEDSDRFTRLVGYKLEHS